jgi:putative spermidine/putrescine transport system ATP-binding protein
MRQGRIEQLGTPVQIYDEPATLFVNNFIGSSNLLAGRIEAPVDGGYRVALANGTMWTVASALRFDAGEPVTVSVRPEQMLLADAPAADRIPVALKLSLPIGGELIHDVTSQAGESLKVAIARRPGMAAGGAGTAYCGLVGHARPALFPATNP